MKKLLTGMVMVAILFAGPGLAFAQTSSTTPNSSLMQSILEQINNLKSQLQTLQSLQDQVKTAQGALTQTAKLLRSLSKGMSGSDVSALQAILAADSSIYPQGLITGFYGNMTENAVRKFQKKNGIEALGFVGPKTLKELNKNSDELGLSEEDDNDSDDGELGKKLCARVPPGHLIAPGWLKKHESEDRQNVPLCQKLPRGIEKKIERRDGELRASTTPPISDSTAPIVSNLFISNVASSSAQVRWSTNEKANSKVWYGTVNPLVIDSPTATETYSSRVISHNIRLSGLATSTAYYYVVTSTDSNGNTATSSQATFTTLDQ